MAGCRLHVTEDVLMLHKHGELRHCCLCSGPILMLVYVPDSQLWSNALLTLAFYRKFEHKQGRGYETIHSFLCFW